MISDAMMLKRSHYNDIITMSSLEFDSHISEFDTHISEFESHLTSKLIQCVSPEHGHYLHVFRRIVQRNLVLEYSIISLHRIRIDKTIRMFSCMVQFVLSTDVLPGTMGNKNLAAWSLYIASANWSFLTVYLTNMALSQYLHKTSALNTSVAFYCHHDLH